MSDALFMFVPFTVKSLGCPWCGDQFASLYIGDACHRCHFARNPPEPPHVPWCECDKCFEASVSPRIGSYEPTDTDAREFLELCNVSEIVEALAAANRELGIQPEPAAKEPNPCHGGMPCTCLCDYCVDMCDYCVDMCECES